LNERPQTVWPDLAALDLAATLDSLHLWSQVVGKIRLSRTPWENHGWHVPLYVSSRGLATGLIPFDASALSLEFDFLADQLTITTTAGGTARVALEPRSVASFYEEVLSALNRLGLPVAISTMPNEIAEGMPFDVDTQVRAYDADVARAYWRALVQIHRVFQLFRTRFVGKCSPIHLFWGSFDLAVTRFSGRAAPLHPGGGIHLPDAVAREAYNQEVSSAGFWPGGGSITGPAFYSYAYPAPQGFSSAQVRPAAARFDQALGEFILPYEAVSESADPDEALLAFLQSSYDAAADLGGWQRGRLEGPQGEIGSPPMV